MMNKDLWACVGGRMQFVCVLTACGGVRYIGAVGVSLLDVTFTTHPSIGLGSILQMWVGQLMKLTTQLPVVAHFPSSLGTLEGSSHCMAVS